MITDIEVLNFIQEKGFFTDKKEVHPLEVLPWLAERNIIIDFCRTPEFMMSRIYISGKTITEDGFPKKFYSEITEPFGSIERAISHLVKKQLI